MNQSASRNQISDILAGLFAATLLGGPAQNARAQVAVVSTVNDIVDFGGGQQVADLPGPDGLVSFREAVLAANNTPGPQTIEFAIPSSEWWLYSDRAILRLEDGAFFINDDDTTVDFYSQTEFSGDTNPDGWEVGIYGLEPNAWGVAAIYLSGDNCLVQGLDRVMQRGYGVRITGNDNRVISCSISGPLYAGVMIQGYVGQPTGTGNTIGGTLPGEGNVLSAGNAGVRIDGPAYGNVVVGNTLVDSPFAGVEVRGAYCCPDYTPFNTRIGGPTPEERNWIADNGKFGEEGFPLGDQVRVEWAVGTIVEGNYIGTTQDGGAVFPNSHGTVGVGVRESEDTTIRNNLISGIRKEGVNHYAGQVFGTAISIYGPNTGVVIEGNLVGTDAAGLTAIPNRSGISFGWLQGYPAGGQIGGPNPADVNTIAFNELSGIAISSGVGGVNIQNNSVHSNGLLGIDLLSSSGSSGVTPNDPGDGDVGGNGLQNFPVLSEVTSFGTTTFVAGTLNSTANTAFNLEFFANGTCDPSGHGEGQFVLGGTVVTTDAAGNADFAVTLSATTPVGQFGTATATNTTTANTSEFSACLAVEGSQSVPGDIDGNGAVDMDDVAMFVGVLIGANTDPIGIAASDLNSDGAANGEDVPLFLAALMDS